MGAGQKFQPLATADSNLWCIEFSQMLRHWLDLQLMSRHIPQLRHVYWTPCSVLSLFFPQVFVCVCMYACVYVYIRKNIQERSVR